MNRKNAPTEEELQNEEFLALNSEASDLYGLIHARYIRSPEGKLNSLIKLIDQQLHFLLLGLALIYGKYL